MSERTPSVIHIIAGARPNFMKVAPLFHALKKESWWRRGRSEVEANRCLLYEMKTFMFKINNSLTKKPYSKTGLGHFENLEHPICTS